MIKYGGPGRMKQACSLRKCIHAEKPKTFAWTNHPKTLRENGERPYKPERMRVSACGECEGCLRENCMKCRVCKDMIKNGVDVSMNLGCSERKCLGKARPKRSCKERVKKQSEDQEIIDLSDDDDSDASEGGNEAASEKGSDGGEEEEEDMPEISVNPQPSLNLQQGIPCGRCTGCLKRADGWMREVCRFPYIPPGKKLLPAVVPQPQETPKVRPKENSKPAARGKEPIKEPETQVKKTSLSSLMKDKKDAGKKPLEKETDVSKSTKSFAKGKTKRGKKATEKDEKASKDSEPEVIDLSDDDSNDNVKNVECQEEDVTPEVLPVLPDSITITSTPKKANQSKRTATSLKVVRKEVPKAKSKTVGSMAPKINQPVKPKQRVETNGTQSEKDPNAQKDTVRNTKRGRPSSMQSKAAATAEVQSNPPITPVTPKINSAGRPSRSATAKQIAEGTETTTLPKGQTNPTNTAKGKPSTIGSTVNGEMVASKNQPNAQRIPTIPNITANGRPKRAAANANPNKNGVSSNKKQKASKPTVPEVKPQARPEKANSAKVRVALADATPEMNDISLENGSEVEVDKGTRKPGQMSEDFIMNILIDSDDDDEEESEAHHNGDHAVDRSEPGVDQPHENNFPNMPAGLFDFVECDPLL